MCILRRDMKETEHSYNHKQNKCLQRYRTRPRPHGGGGSGGPVRFGRPAPLPTLLDGGKSDTHNKNKSMPEQTNVGMCTCVSPLTYAHIYITVYIIVILSFYLTLRTCIHTNHIIT